MTKLAVAVLLLSAASGLLLRGSSQAGPPRPNGIGNDSRGADSTAEEQAENDTTVEVDVAQLPQESSAVIISDRGQAEDAEADQDVTVIADAIPVVEEDFMDSHNISVDTIGVDGNEAVAAYDQAGPEDGDATIRADMEPVWVAERVVTLLRGVQNVATALSGECPDCDGINDLEMGHFSHAVGCPHAALPGVAEEARSVKGQQANVQPQQQDQEECIICMEVFGTDAPPHTLPCNHNHKFHVECLRKWCNKSTCATGPTCPTCRAVISSEHLAQLGLAPRSEIISRSERSSSERCVAFLQFFFLLAAVISGLFFWERWLSTL